MSRRATRLQSGSQGSRRLGVEQLSPSRPHDHGSLPPPHAHYRQLPSAYLETDALGDNGQLHVPVELGAHAEHVPGTHTSSLQLMDQPQQQQQSIRKRRVDKTCDACRLKKTKCDVSRPCSRCVAENRICSYTDRRKTEKMFPQHHVEMLETRVELLTKCLDGLFAKVRRQEDVSHMVEKDGSLAINVLMKELGLVDFQMPFSLDQSGDGFSTGSRKDSVQSVESQMSIEYASPSTAGGGLQGMNPSSSSLIMGQAADAFDFYQQPTGELRTDIHHGHHPQDQHLHYHQHHHHQQQQQEQHYHDQTPPLPIAPSPPQQPNQTDVPIRLGETIFTQSTGLPPFTEMDSKHHNDYEDGFVFDE